MVEIVNRPFGIINQTQVNLYEIKNTQGMSVTVTDYGCTITSLLFPDRKGNIADIVLGFDKLEDYLGIHPYFGCIIGRCANRIGNGELFIQNKHYQLAQNEKQTLQHLHGGIKGFNRQLWQSRIEHNGVLFTYHSPNGEENYPGNLIVKCLITLDERNNLSLYYTAETDAPTVVNLTNHSYFNLAGHENSTLEHELQILSHFVTPLDATTKLPTGEILKVAQTSYDFLQPQKLSNKVAQRPAKDFDINYILANYNGTLQTAASLFEPKSGRHMQMSTNQRGVQFYNAATLGNDKIIGKNHIPYRNFSGLCLEAQNFPDSMHHSHFPTMLLRPGETYQHHTVYQFSTK